MNTENKIDDKYTVNRHIRISSYMCASTTFFFYHSKKQKFAVVVIVGYSLSKRRASLSEIKIKAFV